MIKVFKNDAQALFRALVDQGSQASFIKKSLVNKLQLTLDTIKLPISGVGGHISYSCNKIVSFILKPHFYSDFELEVEAYVLPKITAYAPYCSIKADDLDYLKNLTLADPNFSGTAQIQVLLGASVHALIVDGPVVRGSPFEPIAMNSKLGWIVSGNSGVGSICGLTVGTELGNSCLSFDLEKFWRQEEIFDKSSVLLTPDKQACEDFFVKTHLRNKEGRYIVRLPFKEPPDTLTFKGSFAIAEKMLTRIETRCNQDHEYSKKYHAFFQDYKDLGHMEESSIVDFLNLCYYIPHHGILNSNGKFRSVFNGVARDYNKISINDLLHCGANLLPDLAELLMNWMKYKYVFVSDIQHMFRQILVHEEDRRFQQILWRFGRDEPVKSWSLNTVTYGMISSPFLAIRVMKQLAKDEDPNFPLAVEVLLKETYMDDTLSGGHSLEEAVKKQQQLIELCKVGGFSLHKWKANNKALLNFPSDICSRLVKFIFRTIRASLVS